MTAEAAAVAGVPRVLLRVEGAALFALATLVYARTGTSWWIYAMLFLAPDLTFLGYLAGPRLGAFAYNAAHTTLAPIALGTIGYVVAAPIAISLALVWAAHIGLDRVLGYGLKYSTGFAFTHLGRIGRPDREGPMIVS